MAAAAAAVALVAPSASAVPAPTGSPVLLAAGALLPAVGQEGYVQVQLVVTRDVVGTDFPTQLTVAVSRCDASSCHVLGWTTQPLGAKELYVDPGLNRASLRTRWRGKPLTVSWQGSPKYPVAEQQATVYSGFVNAAFAQARQRTIGSTAALLGRACGYELGAAVAGTAAAALPNQVSGGADRGDLSTVPELRRTPRRC